MIRIYAMREHVYRDDPERRGIHEWHVQVVRDHGCSHMPRYPAKRFSTLSPPRWGRDLPGCIRWAVERARATLRAERNNPTLTPELWAVERW